MRPEWKETKDGNWTHKYSEQVWATIQRREDTWQAEIRVTLPSTQNSALTRFPGDTGRQLTVLMERTDAVQEEIRGAFSRVGAPDATEPPPDRTTTGPGGTLYEIIQDHLGRCDVRRYEGNEFRTIAKGVTRGEAQRIIEERVRDDYRTPRDEIS